MAVADSGVIDWFTFGSGFGVQERRLALMANDDI